MERRGAESQFSWKGLTNTILFDREQGAGLASAWRSRRIFRRGEVSALRRAAGFTLRKNRIGLHRWGAPHDMCATSAATFEPPSLGHTFV